MKFKKFTFFFALFLLWSSCGFKSFQKTMEKSKNTTVFPHYFKKQLPLENTDNQPIVKVVIRGVNYNFMFDTGASLTVIDDSLAKILKLKQIDSREVNDANGVKTRLLYYSLEKITVGGIGFLNVVAIGSKMSKYNDHSCVKISGILGSNLMARAVWQLDYKNRTLTFANHRDSLKLAADKQWIMFNSRYGIDGGSPVIILEQNSKSIGRAIFDTGANGGVILPQKLQQSLRDSKKRSLKQRAFMVSVF